MTKKEIQLRVTQNGRKLALNKFSWDVEIELKGLKELIQGEYGSEKALEVLS